MRCTGSRTKIGSYSLRTPVLSTEQATAVESYNIYFPLIIDDVQVFAEGVEAVLDFEGAASVSWERVADASLVDEVLKKK